jgi:predicted  nucleic acid-binding Zn-ribbon protein
MKKIELRLILLMICLGLFIQGSIKAEDIIPENCLVIGFEGDPARGREFFKKAINQWMQGHRSKAIDNYEKAIIADHSILKHEDHGMAEALLEKYRDKNASQTPALLCKRGFLENILIGNLDDSIDLYKKAAKVAGKEQVQELAKNEAERLSQELDYIEEYQRNVQKELEKQRKEDLQWYLARERKKTLENQVEDSDMELAELEERLAYLQKKEKEVADEMFSKVNLASRYRRRYYYPGAYNTPTADPDSTNVPPGNYGDDGSINSGQVANPYQSTNSNRQSYLYRYYDYRDDAKRAKDQLAQIRAEISGVQRQIKKVKEQKKELREKLNENPLTET